jgi:hypothetical protein
VTVIMESPTDERAKAGADGTDWTAAAASWWEPEASDEAVANETSMTRYESDRRMTGVSASHRSH